ncbi:MAG: PAS domain S-box protein, partial [Candidatus Thermoplasmatota archaeon]|nr:PAS domain S-box protein [Candidatus Thermoplasmatota archaeon]
MVKNSRLFPKSIIDSLPDLFLVIDAKDWTVRYVNDAMAQSLNISKNDLMGKNILKLLPPKVAKLRKQQGEKVISSKEPVYFEDERDGRWFDNTFYPVLDTDGTVIAGAVVVREITKSKLENLQKLADQEKYYSSLIEQSTDLIAVIDTQGIIRSVSTAATKLFGYQLHDLINQPMESYVHKKEIPHLQKIFREIITTNTSDYRIEHHIRHKNGTWIEVESIANNQIQNPQINGIIITTRDITERKQAEHALKDSEHKYRELVDNINDGVCILDQNGYFLYVNNIIIDRSEIPPETFKQITIYDLVLPEFQEIIRNNYKKLLKGEHVTPFEIAYKNASGKTIYVEINARLQINETGEIIFHGITRDITERKKALDDLRESEELYRTLLRTSPDPILITDLQGTIIEMSDNALQVYGGIFDKELIGKNVFSFISSEDIPRGQKFLSKALNEGILRGIQLKVLKKDQTNYDAEVNASVLKDEHGHPKGFIGIFRDITDRKMTEEKIRESEEKYRSIFNTSVGALITTDIDHKITNINPAALRILRYDTSQELIGRSTIEGYAYPEERDLLMKKLRETGYVPNYEITFLRKDGSLVYCLGIVGYLYDKDRKITGTINSFQDISEKAKAEREIIQTRDYLQSVINSSNDMIFTIDVKQRIQSWNLTAEKISGYSEKKLKGKHIIDAGIFINTEEMKTLIVDTFNGKPQKTNEVTLITVDGDHRLLNFSISLMKGENLEPIALLFTLCDITEESTVQRQMKWSQGYLCIDSDPVVSASMIQNFLRENKHVLLLFRGSLSELHKFEHHPNLTLNMLSNERFPQYTNLSLPKDVESVIEAFLIQHVDPVIVIKRLDYLISSHGFDETLKMLYRIHEHIRKHNGLMCIHISKACLDPASLALLQQEFSAFIVSDLENIHLSEEIITVLQTIYKLSS